MTGINNRIIIEDENFIPDRINERLVITAGEIRSTDGTGKNQVANKRRTRGHQADGTQGMTGSIQHFQ